MGSSFDCCSWDGGATYYSLYCSDSSERSEVAYDYYAADSTCTTTSGWSATIELCSECDDDDDGSRRLDSSSSRRLTSTYAHDAYMCYADEQSPMDYSSGSSDGDDRCDSYQCAHAGWYCYDGGSDNYGCSQGEDEAGPCCGGTGAPSLTPSPSASPVPTVEPMPDYEAVYDRGCSSFLHMNQGNYGGTFIESWSTTLEDCAAAVWGYNGQNGCLGDYFFFAWDWGGSVGGSCA